MIRKSVLFMVVICILVSGFSTVTFASTDKNESIFINESFDNYPTYSSPETFLVSGEDGVTVVDISETNKGLYLPSKLGGSIIALPFSPDTGEYIISFDIKSETKAKSGLSVSVSGDSGDFYFIKSGTDGNLYTPDGKYITSISEPRLISVVIFVNPISKRYSVSVNGNRTAINIKCDKIPENPISLIFETSPFDEGGLIVDNIESYSGTAVRNDIPPKAYNPDKYAFEKADTSGEIIVNDHYNIYNKMSFANFDDDNKISFVQRSENDDYMLMEKLVPAAFNIQYDDTEVLNNNRYITFEFDYMVPKMTGSAFIALRDTENTYSYILNTNSKGTTFGANGYSVKEVNSKTWTRIRCQYDFIKKTVSLWVNDKLIYEKIPMGNADKFIRDIRYMRISVSGSDQSTLAFDNFRIYTGSEIIDDAVFMDDAQNIKTSFPDKDEDVLKLINNRILVNTASGSVWNNNSKQICGENAVIIENNKPYILSSVGSTLFTDIAVSDKTTKNGEEYIAFDAVADKNKLNYAYYSDYDFVLISPYEINGYTYEEIQLMSYFVLYDRPDAQKILSDFNKQNPNNEHPRLIARSEDFENVKLKMSKSPLVKSWVDTLIAEADYELTQKPVAFVENDDFLAQARTTLYRIEELAFAYKITGEQKYVDRIWLDIETVGNFPNWDDTGKTLSLSETSAAFALAYDWCYEKWTPEQKKFMEEKMQTHFIDKSSDDYYNGGRSFGNVKTNWNAVCNGGMIMSSLAMLETNPDYYAALISNAVRSSEYIYRDGFAPEGNYSEGPNYWDYAVRYSLKLIGSLDSALGNDYNLPDSKGFNKTAKFMVDIDSSVDVNNYHDSEPGHHNGSMFTYLADKFNDPSIMKLKLKRNELLGTKPEIYDPIFYNDLSVTADNINIPLDSYYGGKEQLVSMRSGWYNGSELFASTHAGVLKGSHMHYDSGSFVFYANGEKWAVDLGRSSISYVTGAVRDNIYNIRAEGHNVIVIDPDETPGMNIYAESPVEKYESKDRGAFEITNLTDVYPDKVNSYKRGMMLDDDRHSFVVRDEIELKGESDVYWFMHTPAKVEIVDKNTAILTQKGKQVKLQIATNASDYEFVTMPAVLLETSPDQYKGEQDKDYAYITKIAIKIKSSGRINIEARMTNVGDPAEMKELKNIPMANWSVPDGELPPVPALDMLYLDGEPIKGFKSEKTLYAFDATPEDFLSHTVEAVANGKQTEISLDDTTGTYSVKVYYADNPSNYNIYTVRFNVIDPYDTIDMYDRYTPVSITASEIPEANNPPEMTIDGNLTTRWAASGDGQWLLQDLGEEKSIDALCIAFHLGEERLYYFKAEYSSDGVNYVTLFDGKTDMEEGYKLIRLDKPINARYIRYTGYGNSRNKFNSVTEFGALVKKEG